jgi:hypothetical protein
VIVCKHWSDVLGVANTEAVRNGMRYRIRRDYEGHWIVTETRQGITYIDPPADGLNLLHYQVRDGYFGTGPLPYIEGWHGGTP